MSVKQCKYRNEVSLPATRRCRYHSLCPDKNFEISLMRDLFYRPKTKICDKFKDVCKKFISWDSHYESKKNVFIFTHGHNHYKTCFQEDEAKYNIFLLDADNKTFPDLQIDLCNSEHLTELSLEMKK